MPGSLRRVALYWVRDPQVFRGSLGLKFLHCIHSVDPRGGGPIQFVRQMAELGDELGYQLEVASVDDPECEHVCSFPAPVHALGPARLQYGYSARFVPWLKETASSYDLVIVNGLWQYPALGTWLALRRTKTPYVVFPHGMLDPWFNRAYPLKHLKKLLYWPWADYRVLKDAQAVLFTSEEERLLARQSFRPYRCNEVVFGFGTLPPPGDAGQQVTEFRRRFPAAGERFLLYMGRIHEKKGVDLLLGAFARVAVAFPDIVLVVAGPGEREAYGASLREGLLRDHPSASERVLWTGMLSGDLKWGALRAAEALVLPSHQENFGLVVSEALSCGTPVLLSDKVNIWREVAAAGAGLVEPDDRDGTEKLLRNWLDKTAADREAMRARCLECYSRQFNIKEVLTRMMPVLERCASPGKGTPGAMKNELSGRPVDIM
ncbi:MAG TPA: glycosyltransferase [Candidatus Obscuribacterales bacterium]